MAMEEQQVLVTPSEWKPYKRIEIDPGGDTLIILQQRGAESDQNSIFAINTTSDNYNILPEIHFLVSKNHLALASRRAQKMFAGDYSEAVPNDTDGLYHWKFDPIFDTTAFEFVIRMIHGKTRNIPRRVTIELLAEVAVVVDDLECHDAVWFFTKGWISYLMGNIPTTLCQNLTKWVFISFVFEEPEIFQFSTKTMIKWSPYPILTHDLPLRPKVVDEMQERRKNILENLIDGLSDLERQLLDGQLGCNFNCRSMLIGALAQGLRAYNLHSSQKSEQSSLLTLGSAIEQLKDFEWPKYYCPVEDSPSGKSHKPCWRGNFAYSSDEPRELVCHECDFNNHVEMLLSTSETELEGLKLSNYL